MIINQKISLYLDRFLVIPVLFVLVFLFSYYVGREFIYGDQLVYRDVYEGVVGKQLFDAYEYYRVRIHSGDLGHFSLIWVFASYIDKDLLMSFLNGVLACCSYLVFRNWGGGRLISLFIICSGAYFMALYFSAERLKLSFIFVALFWLYFGYSRLISVIMALLAFLSHGQSLIFFSSIAVNSGFKALCVVCNTLKIRLRGISFFILLCMIVVVGGYLFGGYLLDKFNAYRMLGAGAGFWKTLPFVFGGIVCAKKLIEPLIVFFVPVFLVAMLGSDRFLIMVFFVFLYYGFKSNSGYNLFVVIPAIYYAVGGFEYTQNVLNYGVNVAP